MEKNQRRVSKKTATIVKEMLAHQYEFKLLGNKQLQQVIDDEPALFSQWDFVEQQIAEEYELFKNAKPLKREAPEVDDETVKQLLGMLNAIDGARGQGFAVDNSQLYRSLSATLMDNTFETMLPVRQAKMISYIKEQFASSTDYLDKLQNVTPNIEYQLVLLDTNGKEILNDFFLSMANNSRIRNVFTSIESCQLAINSHTGIYVDVQDQQERFSSWKFKVNTIITPN